MCMLLQRLQRNLGDEGHGSRHPGEELGYLGEIIGFFSPCLTFGYTAANISIANIYALRDGYKIKYEKGLRD